MDKSKTSGKSPTIDLTTPSSQVPLQLTPVPKSQLPDFLRGGKKPVKVVVVGRGPAQYRVMQSSSKQAESEDDPDSIIKTEDVDPLAIDPPAGAKDPVATRSKFHIKVAANSKTLQKLPVLIIKNPTQAGSKNLKIVTTKQSGSDEVKTEEDTPRPMTTRRSGSLVERKIERENLGVGRQPYPTRSELITLDIVDSDQEETDKTEQSRISQMDTAADFDEEELWKAGPCISKNCQSYIDPKNSIVDEPILENPDLIFLKRLFKIPAPTKKDLEKVKLFNDKEDQENIVNISDSDQEDNSRDHVKDLKQSSHVVPLRKNVNPRNITDAHLERIEFAPNCFMILRNWMEKNMEFIKENEVILEELIEKRENIQDKIQALKMEHKILEQKRNILLKRKRTMNEPEETSNKSKRDTENIPNENITGNNLMTNEHVSLVCDESMNNFDPTPGALVTEDNNCPNLTQSTSAQAMTAEENAQLDLLLESQKAIVALANEMQHGFV